MVKRQSIPNFYFVQKKNVKNMFFKHFKIVPLLTFLLTPGLISINLIAFYF